jgi:molybdopterin-guanine dinucleotide biosynthesis protein A
MSLQINSLFIVILAGGLSRRMDGKDKGLISFRSKPLVKHVIERLESQLEASHWKQDSIVISANRNLKEYCEFGYPVITDRVSNYAGPLAGIDAAFDSTDRDWVLSCPCDTPLIPADLLSRMCAAVEEETAYVIHDGKRLQSGFVLYPRSWHEKIKHALEQGQFAVHHLLEANHAKPVDFSDCREAFVNINSLEDLKALDPSR